MKSRGDWLLPTEVLHLKSKRDGSVYRLIGTGRESSGVIAKRAHCEKGAIERAVYEEVLAIMSVNAIGYFGSVDEDDEPYLWLFLEDAGDRRYSPASPEDRVLGAHWLGSLLGASEAARRLPDRGPAFYHRHLKSLLTKLPTIQGRSSISTDGIEILRSIETLCRHVDKHWDALADFCEPIPRTLVHGDCLPKNVHVRETADSREIAFFDWGGAGLGLAATDLGLLALPKQGPPGFDPGYEAYLEAVGDRWDSADIALIEQLAQIGQLFWVLKVVDKSLPDLYKPLPHVLDNFRLYAATLMRSMDMPAWAPTPALQFRH
ncbi:MAG: aminoglycoside phosphotransferase family protein [Acidimicrobiia bacterium]|nr:aminoglycoside phosphotransferase family protein [Acidimicrobiia bacterium]